MDELFNMQNDHEGICGGEVFVTSETTITDGHLHESNGTYHDNADCTWVVTPPDGGEVDLSLSFLIIGGGHDFLTVYEADGETVIAKVTGRRIPPVLTSSSGGMVIKFTSNGE
jgi:hypothetical protein